MQLFAYFSFLMQDRYILGSMIFLYLVCSWHAVVTLIGDNVASSEADKDAFIVFASCFACLQVLFIASVVISVSWHLGSRVFILI